MAGRSAPPPAHLGGSREMFTSIYSSVVRLFLYSPDNSKVTVAHSLRKTTYAGRECDCRETCSCDTFPQGECCVAKSLTFLPGKAGVSSPGRHGRIDRMGCVIGLGSLRPERTPGTSSQAVCTHDSCDTILRAGHSESAKFTSHSRTAVAPGVAVRVNDSDLVKELLIGTVAFTRFTLPSL